MASPTPDQVLAEILDARYSCRAFGPEPVPEPVIDRMLALAQRTASWCNSQAWQVHLVSGEALAQLTKSLGEHVMSQPQAPDIPGPTSYDGVYLERRRGAGYGLYEALGIARDDHDGRVTQMLENFRFFGAPHTAVISTPKALGTYGAVDCGAYVSTLLTAAKSLGVDTIAQASIAMYADHVREFLGVAEDRDIVCAVSFGYGDPDHPANAFRTDRADLATVVERLG